MSAQAATPPATPKPSTNSEPPTPHGVPVLPNHPELAVGAAGDTTPTSILHGLGIVGYDTLEPAILAALATEEPLLLVSEHGAAKSLLLTRLGKALSLELRHYNASLLQFDDLAGFPIPDDRGGIRYAAPAGAVWDAEAVFLDEIGRCRPEIANKLFPLIHERRLQGTPLERLKYRWAATNPPPGHGSARDGDLDPYLGVEPLDPALADRFTYVLSLPAWHTLSVEDRAAVIRGTDLPPDEPAEAAVRDAVQQTRALLPEVTREIGDAVVTYILCLAPQLATAGLTLTGRRVAALRRAIIAIWAASRVLGKPTGSAAIQLALDGALPDVHRRGIDRAVLAAAHQAAWRHTVLPVDDPDRQLADAVGPYERAALAVRRPDLPPMTRAEVITGALAMLSPVQAPILAWFLLPTVTTDSALPGIVSEAVIEVLRPYVVPGTKLATQADEPEWQRLLHETINRLGITGESTQVFAHVASVNLPFNHRYQRRDPEVHLRKVVEAWTACQQAFSAREG